MNKAPGPDGIPAEFYQQFWEELNQRQAILRLLFKKDNNKLLKNWRPISLVNSDYKLAAKVIATCLKKVSPIVIDEDQTCGVPGRSIYENLFRLRDTIPRSLKNYFRLGTFGAYSEVMLYSFSSITALIETTLPSLSVFCCSMLMSNLGFIKIATPRLGFSL